MGKASRDRFSSYNNKSLTFVTNIYALSAIGGNGDRDPKASRIFNIILSFPKNPDIFQKVIDRFPISSER
jgi:hypothetical protein